MPKRVYVISDLHIGGAYPDPAEPAARGFRLCTQIDSLSRFVHAVSERGRRDNRFTELVINGDFLDFLAEEREIRDPVSGECSVGWQPLVDDPAQAVTILHRIINRDKSFFDALKEFLSAGHKLTILLGNHDIELSFPAVRRAVLQELDADGKRFSFIYDGEAYAIGSVLIEHGNRYDEWNVVTHDTLRRFRSVQSRQERLSDAWRRFEPPAGSFLVAGVMNEIKSRYPFIDLLKPASAAAVPILLALAPEYRARILRIAALLVRSREHLVGADGLPSCPEDIAADETSAAPEVRGKALVTAILRERFLGRGLEEFIAATVENPTYTAGDTNMNGDIQSGSVQSFWSIIRLLFARPSDPVSTRLPILLSALEGTRGDFSFNRLQETKNYRSAAERLLNRGFQAVVFGHTHLAKEIKLSNGTYINTGTWADLLPFPATILDPDNEHAKESVQDAEASRLSRLARFVENMATAQLSQYVRFLPTYARIELDDDGAVMSAHLCDYEVGSQVE